MKSFDLFTSLIDSVSAGAFLRRVEMRPSSTMKNVRFPLFIKHDIANQDWKWMRREKM